MSVYTTHWFRLPGQTLEGKPEPHKIIKGIPEDFIISYTDKVESELEEFQPTIKADQPKKETKELIYNEGKTKEEFIERLIDLLDDSRADDRTEWTEVSFIINNELGKDGLNLFQSFSQRSDKYSDKKDDKWFMDLQQKEREEKRKKEK